MACRVIKFFAFCKGFIEHRVGLTVFHTETLPIHVILLLLSAHFEVSNITPILLNLFICVLLLYCISIFCFFVTYSYVFCLNIYIFVLQILLILCTHLVCLNKRFTFVYEKLTLTLTQYVKNTVPF